MKLVKPEPKQELEVMIRLVQYVETETLKALDGSKCSDKDKRATRVAVRDLVGDYTRIARQIQGRVR